MSVLNSQNLSAMFRLAAIFTVFCTMIGGLLFVFSSSNDRVIVEKLPTGVASCAPIKGILSDKTVVLRVDDVQAYSWVKTVKHMITDVGELGIPITLGVIPVGLENDKELSTFLKSHACRVEFALHGLTHSSEGDGSIPEFGILTKDEAMESVSTGLDILRSVSTEPVVTWIPPLNVHSKGTIAALQDLGFKYLSAEGDSVFDYDAATFSYGTTALVPPEKVVEVCLATFIQSPYCIIMIHPQDFADGLEHNQEKYEHYFLGLLKALVAEGVTFARFNELPVEAL